MGGEIISNMIRMMTSAAICVGIYCWTLPVRAADDPDFSRLLQEKCAKYEDEIAATSKRLPHSQVGEKADRPALARQLREMAVIDQQVRDRWIALQGDPAALAEMQRADAANLAKLRHILHQNGFPTRAMIGSSGVQDAWLLVQHANDDKLQESVLAQLKPRFRTREISAQDYALLTDRVLRHQGKPQIYGSQFNDSFELEPTRDMAHLDDRRRAMGLPSMAAYKCMLKAFYRK
ncbi:MAG TPA: DUF6624 domain-containing protein [Steroidobacteraceae bacterium]